MSNYDDVGSFHEKFGLDNTTYHGAGPRAWDEKFVEFRTKFLQEELDEFKWAFLECDHVKMFDALLDIVYVAMGTAHALGYPWQAGWDRVQRANMAKVRAKKDGSDSARGSSYDVVKPKGWIPPDIEGVLRFYRFTVQNSTEGKSS